MDRAALERASRPTLEAYAKANNLEIVREGLGWFTTPQLREAIWVEVYEPRHLKAVEEPRHLLVEDDADGRRMGYIV